MSDPIIAASGLTRRFGDTLAVAELTLEVRRGEVFGFLGHNGAGKTTTVRLLNGVLTPSAGQARVLGLDPMADGPALRRQTGVLTETPSLDERLSARLNLSLYADLYGVPKGEVKPRVEALLKTFELAERADDKVGAFSKGMKQRLALARTVVHQPVLLFLDEPTAALDPVAARQVHEMILHTAREGRTVFMNTHNLVEAQRLCDRVAVMEHGRLVAIGSPHDLARRLVRNLTVEFELAPDSTAQALQVLQQAPGAASAGPRNGVIVVSGAERAAIPDLIALLVGAGVPIYQVAPQEPTLEDVYFALHSETEVKP
ncbi:MAG TPA: ABC transporter ATP-binding protein [Anaerolineae bacterium]|nr:ABC transporter ATP-binding protein [Anaerolineae bacterium]HNU02889.1 ABC transporter ATP-binding protein [Anaerolineae bacterium]